MQTNGKGVDHMIEVGGAITIMKSIASVRFAGWIHNIGFLSTTVRLNVSSELA